MRIVSRENCVEVDSDTCGSLTELLNNPPIPISIAIAKDIKPTINHSHKRSTEIYWVTEGTVVLEVTSNENVQTVSLEEGSILAIEPNELHKVISSSEKNNVIVLSTPPWSPNDEFIT